MSRSYVLHFNKFCAQGLMQKRCRKWGKPQKKWGKKEEKNVEKYGSQKNLMRYIADRRHTNTLHW